MSLLYAKKFSLNAYVENVRRLKLTSGPHIPYDPQ